MRCHRLQYFSVLFFQWINDGECTWAWTCNRSFSNNERTLYCSMTCGCGWICKTVIPSSRSNVIRYWLEFNSNNNKCKQIRCQHRHRLNQKFMKIHFFRLFVHCDSVFFRHHRHRRRMETSFSKFSYVRNTFAYVRLSLSPSDSLISQTLSWLLVAPVNCKFQSFVLCAFLRFVGVFTRHCATLSSEKQQKKTKIQSQRMQKIHKYTLSVVEREWDDSYAKRSRRKREKKNEESKTSLSPDALRTTATTIVCACSWPLLRVNLTSFSHMICVRLCVCVSRIVTKHRICRHSSLQGDRFEQEPGLTWMHQQQWWTQCRREENTIADRMLWTKKAEDSSEWNVLWLGSPFLRSPSLPLLHHNYYSNECVCVCTSHKWISHEIVKRERKKMLIASDMLCATANECVKCV